jgi:hypothetical protein
MDLGETTWKAVDSMYVAEARDQWRALVNPKFHFRAYWSPPLAPLLSQMNPVQSVSLRSVLTLSSYLRLGLPSGFFLQVFRPKC